MTLQCSSLYMSGFLAYTSYHRWEVFTLNTIRVKMFCGVNFSQFCSILIIFITVDDYNRDKVPGAFLAFNTTRYWKSLVLLVVVVNGIFTLGEWGVDFHARLFIDYCRIIFFVHMLNFRCWSQPRNYLTAKFSRSILLVVSYTLLVLQKLTLCVHVLRWSAYGLVHL